VSSQAEAEAYEEGRINCLMRRLSSLAKEKGRLIVELEQEEEMVGHFQSLLLSCAPTPSFFLIDLP
jgi:hypothetical protein